MSHTLYQMRTADGVTVLELTLPDHADPTDLDRLNVTLAELMNTVDSRGWVVDLERCVYIGSALLGTLVNIRHALRSRGRVLVLCGLSDDLLDVFRTSALERLFTVVATQEDAIGHAQR